jgi:serine/threonine-protein kinase
MQHLRPSPIRPTPDTTIPPPPGAGSRESYGLPADLVRRSVQRLGLVALLYASAYTILHVISLVTEPAAAAQPVSWAAYGLAVLSSGAMFGLTRRPGGRPERILDAGLVYLVVGALAIVLDDFTRPGTWEIGIGEITWACVWILGFPLIVPSHPRKTLFAALAAASMTPLALLVAWSLGHDAPPEWGLVIRVLLPGYLCVVLAVLASRVVYGLGTDVTRARLMGSYHLERKLGSGGMGEVWLARHAMLAFPAAIKLIRPDMLRAAGEGAEALSERFTREARATAGLRSPHSIRLFDFGVTEAGAFYYVMELLSGLDLRTLIETYGPIPPERAAYILAQACRALADAHEQGLIHRDVKPANIYLCRMGIEHDFVKMLDFGLVAPVSRGEDMVLTAPHLPLPGTPAFMSPEMILRHQQIDGRSDLYALGCVAFWLVTGTYPFQGKTLIQVLHNHVHTPPPPLSQVAEFPIPAEFERLVLACLAKRPEERPAGAEALGRRLEACGFDAPWTAERARDWWELHRPEVPKVPEEAGRLEATVI